ncbi:polysaccharide pyruvyl transferase family protein [Candidatus Gracilibacteria bacterium]|nr:polysaccharide pyruvyl transferase family protein [Candidatus Gracilibacteria bacterium]
MIISIFASIGAQNLGDELILKNEIKLLEKEYGKETKFIVFSYDYKNPFYKKSNIVYKEYFPIGIKNIKNIFRNIFNFLIFLNVVIKSDLIVVGGGGIIYDNEKQTTKNPLDSWIFRTNIFRFFRKKIEFFAVGLNIKNKINYKKIEKIFSRAYKINVRDDYSLELLYKLGIKSNKVLDPVFYDNINWQNNNCLLKIVNSYDFNISDLEGIDLEGKKIALAFRKGYLSNKKGKLAESFEEGKINELINYILKSGGEVILLPHSFHKNDEVANDYKFLSKFLRVTEKVRIIKSLDDVYLKYIYKEMDLVLAMRLHSIILSQVYNIPFIGISYSIKTNEILNQIKGLK